MNAAVADGAIRVGEEAGLPLHRLPAGARPPRRTAPSQEGAVGKVLIDVTA